MNEGILYRATQDFEVSGRTIEGLALPWEQWQVVRDLRGPTYPEAHLRSAFDESLRRDPGVRPLYSMHEYAFDPTADPIGVTHFMPAAEALMFRGFLSKTRKADEQLELIKDGAKRAVSVGFEPLQSRRVQRPEGLGRLRVESKLRELSIAPTGFGQYPESKILAMRAATDATFGDITDAVSDAIALKLFGTDGPPDGVYVYLPAIGDGWAVYCVEGGPLDKPELNDTWRYEYTIATDGSVTLSDEAVRVEQQYVPISVRSTLPGAAQLQRMRARRPLLRSHIDPPR